MRLGLNGKDPERVLGMLLAGTSGAEMGRHFGLHRPTIQRLRRRFQQTCSARDDPRSGQPRVTTSAHDHHIKTCVCGITDKETWDHMHSAFVTSSGPCEINFGSF